MPAEVKSVEVTSSQTERKNLGASPNKLAVSPSPDLQLAQHVDPGSGACLR